MNKKTVTFLVAATIIALAVFLFDRKPTVSTPVANEVKSEAKAEPELGMASEPKQNDLVDAKASTPVTANPDQTVAKAPDSNTSRKKFAESLEPNLQQEFLSAGFSQYEADLAVKEILTEWTKDNEAIKLSEGIDRITATLKLDADRKKKLNDAIGAGIKRTSQVTYDQWDSCMRYRAQRLSACANGFADEASRIVAEVSNQALAGAEWAKAREVIKPLIDDVAAKCAVDREAVESAFDIFLGNCP